MSDPANIDAQLDRAARQFEQAYGRTPTHAAVAPGRVNLIGEHTDYNDGFVLPMAIERQTLIVAAPRDDRQVRLRSTDFEADAAFELSESLKAGEPKWSNYVRGVLVGCVRAGLDVPGFDALVASTVPVGGGLSSSAALEVASATLAEGLAGRALDPVDKALLCQQAEHEFAGMPCGIMDQFIATLGQPGAALLIDCRSRQTQLAPLDDESVAVLIVNTNVKHELTGGEYAERRSQCESAAKKLGVPALRDATMAMLDAKRGELSDVEYRRARHVIGENERTVKAVGMMEARRWGGFGELMLRSHASLRDDYEVSCRELDLLVELAERRIGDGGVIGSRMTGGGFGGCTVSLVRADAADAIAEQIGAEYQRQTGIEPAAFVTRAAGGAAALSL